MARTRADDYTDKRNAILARSAALFADRGIDRASMAEIAKACGVSKALLYHYYTNKDELLFDVIHAHLSAMEEKLAEADDPATTPEQRLRNLIAKVLDIYRDADDLHKVQLSGIPMLPNELAEQIWEIERRIMRRFSAVIREINPNLDGEQRLTTPMTMSVLGMLNWVYMWFRDGGPVSREDYAEAVADMVLNGMKGMR